MICPKCQFEQADGSLECSRCGVIFDKYLAWAERYKDHKDGASLADDELDDADEEKGFVFLRNLLFSVETEVNPFYFGGRVIVYLLLLVWGWKFILTPMGTNYVGHSFMHNINLPFHEAGHVIFSFFGRFISVLGGTLGQLLMPVICMFALLFGRRDTFGASVALWWLAESFMDVAPYVNDARARKLILLGGVTGREAPGYHDWEYLLRTLDWLTYDHLIANLSYGFGISLMIAAFLWGGCTLYLQFKNLEKF